MTVISSPNYLILGQWLQKPTVLLQTTLGDIRIQLEPELAPLTAANWLSYVNGAFFDGLVFHRVIAGFMVQGGGFDGNLAPKTTLAPIDLEINTGLANTRGTLAMARTGNPNSATSQFFINVVDNGFLDYGGEAQLGYTVFGEVTAGMDVVDAIAATATTTENGYANVPVTDVVMQQVQCIDTGKVRTATGLVELTWAEATPWEYSVNAGLSWQPGSGNALHLAPTQYAAGQVRVRATTANAPETLLPAIDVDPLAPSVQIASDHTALLWNDNSAQIRLTLSETSTDFSLEDIMVLGGALSDFQGSGRNYTATLTADGTYGREVLIRVLSGRFTNTNGVTNIERGDGLASLTLTADSVVTPPLASALVPNGVATPTSAPLLVPQGEWLSNPLITLSTPGSKLTVELLPNDAPLASTAWLSYLHAGAYAGTYIDYLTTSTVGLAKAGTYNGSGNYQSPLFAPIPLESDNGLANQAGALTMFRGSALAATSGFFVNLKDNPQLNYSSAQSPGYAAFGKAVGDTSALTLLAQTTVDANGFPLTAIQVSTEVLAAGTVRSVTGDLVLGGFAPNSLWRYTLDAGQTWDTGQGSTLSLPNGVYAPHQVQVQALNADGSTSNAVLSTLPYQVLAGVNATSWNRAAATIETQVWHQSDGYTVEASVATPEAQAISLGDVLGALKIYLHKPTDTPDQLPFQAIAADINADGVVNLSDVLNLLKIYLHKPTASDIAPHWTFINANDSSSAVTPIGANGAPITTNNTDVAPIDWNPASDMPIELIGILRGDVDGSWGT